MAVPSMKDRRGRKKAKVDRSVFLIAHAPSIPDPSWQWCDGCDRWRENTIRTEPKVRRGAVLQPSLRICRECFVAEVGEWDRLKKKERYLGSWLTVEGIAEARQKILDRLKVRVRLDGFRKGKVPEEELLRRFGSGVEREAREVALVEVYNRDADRPE